MINQGFCWGGKEGDHDVLGLRFDRNNNVVEAVSYEIKGRATEVGRDKAFGQARVKQRAMIGLYGEAKLRTFYVTQNYVENIPFSKRRD